MGNFKIAGGGEALTAAVSLGTVSGGSYSPLLFGTGHEEEIPARQSFVSVDGLLVSLWVELCNVLCEKNRGLAPGPQLQH